MNDHGERGIDRINGLVNEFMAGIHPEKDSFEAAVQSLQQLLQQLTDEDDQDQRIQVLQSSFELLIAKYSSNLSPAQKVQVKLWLGHRLEQMGAWENALKVFLAVVVECEQDDSLFHQKAEALRWIGHIQVMQNTWDEASAYYEKSLSCSIEHGDREGEAHARNALGYFFFEKGKFGDAATEWHHALELAEKLKIVKLMASFYGNLGTLAIVQGDWEKALAYYGESVPRFEQLGQQRSLAETYHNMAMTYADVGRWAEAGNYYEKSYEIAKAIDDVRLQAMVKLNRVRLYLAISDLVYAGAFCRQALRVFLKLQDHLGEADAYKYFGIIDTHKGEWDNAEKHFGKSIELNSAYQHPLGEAEAYVEYGQMLKLKGDVLNATEKFAEARGIYAQLGLEKEVENIQNILSGLS